MFHWIIFLLLIISLSCNFDRCTVYFQSFMNLACRSTQNAASIKRFLRLHTFIEPLDTKIKKFIQTHYYSSTVTLAPFKSDNRLAVQVLTVERRQICSATCDKLYWVQFVLKSCEILHSVRALYHKSNFARAAHFFVHFFAVVLHDYNVKLLETS